MDKHLDTSLDFGFLLLLMRNPGNRWRAGLVGFLNHQQHDGLGNGFLAKPSDLYSPKPKTTPVIPNMAIFWKNGPWMRRMYFQLKVRISNCQRCTCFTGQCSNPQPVANPLCGKFGRHDSHQTVGIEQWKKPWLGLSYPVIWQYQVNHCKDPVINQPVFHGIFVKVFVPLHFFQRVFSASLSFPDSKYSTETRWAANPTNLPRPRFPKDVWTNHGQVFTLQGTSPYSHKNIRKIIDSKSTLEMGISLQEGF